MATSHHFKSHLIIILFNKTTNITQTKLASVSLCCKSHLFKTASIKILSEISKQGS